MPIDIEQIKTMTAQEYTKYCANVMLQAKFDDNEELSNVEFWNGDEWIAINACWNWDAYCYRIKLEPAIIPLDFLDAESLLGEKCKNIKYNYYAVINGVSDKYIYFGDQVTYATLQREYTRLDGSKFEKVKI